MRKLRLCFLSVLKLLCETGWRYRYSAASCYNREGNLESCQHDFMYVLCSFSCSSRDSAKFRLISWLRRCPL